MNKNRYTMNKNLLMIPVLGIFFSVNSYSQLQQRTTTDSIAGHIAKYDGRGSILSWYEPEIEGAGISHVAQLASEFIRSGVPAESQTGEKMYFVTCCFQGPHMHNNKTAPNGLVAERWPHNPACFFAGSVQSFALGYRVYSGDNTYLQVVKEMLDYQLQNGTTPSGWVWPEVPYASSDPFKTVYEGATGWENDGMRGDGLHGIEPDKVGELGYGYLMFYEITGNTKYLDAALHCADALAKNLRNVGPDKSSFAEVKVSSSPWPFRVNAETGRVISDYSSNIIEPVKLLSELIRIQPVIHLDSSNTESYRQTRDIIWNWLYSKSGPMKTFIWNGYFEDVPNDPDRANRLQITPMETARYIIRHPEMDPNSETNVPLLIYWVKSAFGTGGMDAIKEQTWCYEPMGSHTARYASVCALWYERTGNPWFKDEANRYFNLATYMTDENGVVRVGPNWPGSWFSDGYSDYVKHFMDGLGAIPEWAPKNENHLLRSSSVVQDILYEKNKVSYTTFDSQSEEVLRLAWKPARVLVNDQKILENQDNGKEGWKWQSLGENGILRLKKINGKTVTLVK
jgi:hypothetical protein